MALAWGSARQISVTESVLPDPGISRAATSQKISRTTSSGSEAMSTYRALKYPTAVPHCFEIAAPYCPFCSISRFASWKLSGVSAN